MDSSTDHLGQGTFTFGKRGLSMIAMNRHGSRAIFVVLAGLALGGSPFRRSGLPRDR